MARRSMRDTGEPASDYLTNEPPDGRRSRAWEQTQRAAGVVATYRGIPAEVQEGIKNMAAEIGVPVGEIARLALERLIDDYEHGRVKPEAHVVHARRSIFDAGGSKR